MRRAFDTKTQTDIIWHLQLHGPKCCKLHKPKNFVFLFDTSLIIGLHSCHWLLEWALERSIKCVLTSKCSTTLSVFVGIQWLPGMTLYLNWIFVFFREWLVNYILQCVCTSMGLYYDRYYCICNCTYSSEVGSLDVQMSLQFLYVCQINHPHWSYINLTIGQW